MSTILSSKYRIKTTFSFQYNLPFDVWCSKYFFIVTFMPQIANLAASLPSLEKKIATIQTNVIKNGLHIQLQTSTLFVLGIFSQYKVNSELLEYIFLINIYFNRYIKQIYFMQFAYFRLALFWLAMTIKLNSLWRTISALPQADKCHSHTNACTFYKIACKHSKIH